MKIPTSFGVMDAGQIMQYWERCRGPENKNRDDPIGSYLLDGPKVYVKGTMSGCDVLIDCSEPGELVDREEASHVANFFALSYELIPKLVGALAGGMSTATHKMQLISMMEAVDSITGLFNRFGQHDKDCIAMQKQKDAWEESSDCDCGFIAAQGQIKVLVDDFRKSVKAMCDEIDAEAASA